MADCLVTCINKPHHLSPHEHITHIGNSAGGWRITITSAVNRIDLQSVFVGAQHVSPA